MSVKNHDLGQELSLSREAPQLTQSNAFSLCQQQRSGYDRLAERYFLSYLQGEII